MSDLWPRAHYLTARSTQSAKRHCLSDALRGHPFEPDVAVGLVDVLDEWLAES